MYSVGEWLVGKTIKDAEEKLSKKYILNMYKNGYSIELIAEVVEMSTDSVKKVIEKNGIKKAYISC